MAEMLLTRTPAGALVPQRDEDAERIRRYKVGATIRCTTTEMRNGKFHKKWFALAKFAFDIWSETCPEAEFKGLPVLPEFERFRRDLVVMAGFYRPVWAANGDLRVEPESLSWGSMDADRFDALYSATIDAVLSKVLAGTKLTGADLRAQVDRVLEFDR